MPAGTTNSRLIPDSAAGDTEQNLTPELIDVELFAGAGGMSVGLRAAGFGPCRFYEVDSACCETLRHNVTGPQRTIIGRVFHGPAQEVDWKPLRGNVRLLAAGAPCQPFSIAGKHTAHNDGRNLFPELIRAIRETSPMAVVVENVRGLARASFRAYFEYVMRQIKFASIPPKKHERWRTHNNKLKLYDLSSSVAPDYQVAFRVVDAADYGVPQNRSRLFIVATRFDMPAFSFPQRTHSRDALIRELGRRDYWDRHEKRKPLLALPEYDESIAEETLPWKTVRDAVSDLPPPSELQEGSEMNHWEIPGARVYSRHTGSRLDWPSKTIKAGVHGVPGGENAYLDDAGAFRYYTLRETARLQTFPDDHLFIGSRTKITRQIGNAVPCKLAEAVALPLSQIVNATLCSLPLKRETGSKKAALPNRRR